MKAARVLARGILLAMKRLLAATLVICSCAVARATLVAVVPARDGLVVAADSRFTFMGAACDGVFKLVTAQSAPHTVASVTGDSIFVAPPPAGVEPCRYLQTAPRLLDLSSIVRAYLHRGGDASQLSQAGLAASCVEAVRRFQKKYPDALRAYRGREVASVVVAGYDPAHGRSTIGRFAILIDPRTGDAVTAASSNIVVDAGSPRGVWIFGASGYVDRHVYNGAGRRFLDPQTLAFLNERAPIGKVTVEQAQAVARNMIRATSREAEMERPPSGIGGEMRVVVVK